VPRVDDPNITSYCNLAARQLTFVHTTLMNVSFTGTVTKARALTHLSRDIFTSMPDEDELASEPAPRVSHHVDESFPPLLGVEGASPSIESKIRGQGLARRWILIHRQRANQGVGGGESQVTNALGSPSHEPLCPQCRDMRNAPLPRLLPTKCGPKPTCAVKP
jgi:hypothetical protein